MLPCDSVPSRCQPRAQAGVAYLMSVLLSSPSVDPNNLAPKGTVINAETAAARAHPVPCNKAHPHMFPHF